MNKIPVAYPIGLRVADVRMMTKAELENECWEDNWGSFAVAIIFEDGSKVYASSDPEGNDVGCLFGETKDGQQVVISPLDDQMIKDDITS